MLSPRLIWICYLFLFLSVPSGLVWGEPLIKGGCLYLGDSISTYKKGSGDILDKKTIVEYKNDVRAKLSSLIRKLNLSLDPEIIFNENEIIGVKANCTSGEGDALITLDIERLKERIRSSERTMDFILAHELAHVLQLKGSSEFLNDYCNRNIDSVKTIELLADFMAGHITRSSLNIPDHAEFTKAVTSLGDYRFSEIDHHGKVTERLNAFYFGVNVASSGRPLIAAKFIKNSDNFLEVLGGPSFYKADYEKTNNYYLHAIEGMYE